MATENAIIFINNYDSPKKLPKNLSVYQFCKLHLTLHPAELPKRVFRSFVPPFFGKNYQKIHVDLVGPIVALFCLVLLLQYGHNNKTSYAVSNWAPTDSLLAYLLIMPFFTYVLCKISSSTISLIEIVSLLGYSLFGHIFTLATSLILYNEESNFVFFVCLLLFGGLSTLRIVLVLMSCIKKPALRLVVCSFVSVVQLLYLVFLHFLYMHRRFIYGVKNRF